MNFTELIKNLYNIINNSNYTIIYNKEQFLKSFRPQK